MVFLDGARQTGKTTLVRHLARELGETVYVTLDDGAVLAAVAHDPAGFIGRFGQTAVLDEVQKAPALFPALKASVGRDRRPGRFLLTGSADVMLLPTVSESLAGRMEPLSLRSLSQGELEGVRETFIDRLFGEPAFRMVRVVSSGLALEERIGRGGFPEAVGRTSTRRHSKERWPLMLPDGPDCTGRQKKRIRHGRIRGQVSGGRGWIRTTEVNDSRFTVCPVWPLRYPTILVGRRRALSVANRAHTIHDEKMLPTVRPLKSRTPFRCLGMVSGSWPRRPDRIHYRATPGKLRLAD